MTQYRTMLGKEFMDSKRSGRLLILGIIFLVFGIMNPAIAKLTPKLFEFLSDEIEAQGFNITVKDATATDSWLQFLKNYSTLLLIFLIVESNRFIKEYRTGTLTLLLTKGLRRASVVASKATYIIAAWTVGYGIYFGVTYVYTAYYWDMSTIPDIAKIAFVLWLFGIFMISVLIFLSCLCRELVQVLLGTGGVCLALSFFGFLPKISDFLPTMLSANASKLLAGEPVANLTGCILITAVLSVLLLLASFPVFRRKTL